MLEPMDGLPVVSISRVLNVGYALKARLEAVAAREGGIDATTLGRRIVEAGGVGEGAVRRGRRASRG